MIVTKLNNMIDNILKEARWIKSKSEDWLEKIVEHTTSGGQRTKVKVKSLPPEEQKRYRPKEEKPSQEEVQVFWRIIIS